MEIKQIKDLMAAMGRTGMQQLKLKRGDVELTLEREQNGRIRYFNEFPDQEEEENPLRSDIELHRTQTFMKRKPERSVATESAIDEGIDESNYAYITSPIVGTFYSASTPEAAPFVQVGDSVQKESIVCIVEAMKVMNEIKAGVAGKVAAVLVENGQPIEFGTKLFQIQIG